MTESEFILYTDQFFIQLENEIEMQELDVDCLLSGNVFTIECDEEQIVINRQIHNQQLWIASRTGGFHFVLKDGCWRSTKDSSDFFVVLNDVLSHILKQQVVIASF